MKIMIVFLSVFSSIHLALPNTVLYGICAVVTVAKSVHFIFTFFAYNSELSRLENQCAHS